MRIASDGVAAHRPEPPPPQPPPPPPPRPAPPADGVDPLPDPGSRLFDPPAPPPPTYTREQADKDAKTLYDATEGGLTGWGTDEGAIWRTLEGKSAADIDLIRQSYRDHYDKQLDQVLRDELGGQDRHHVDALLRGRENDAETNAVKIQAELEGAFGDEEEVLKILERASPAERQAITEAYGQKHGSGAPDPRRALLDRIEADGNFDGAQKERARSLLGVSHADTPEQARELEAEAAAGRIKVALDGMGTDEGTVREMLGDRSTQEIQDLASAYQQRYGQDLRARLVDELEDGAEEQEILSLFDAGKEGGRDPQVIAERDAARIKQAVDGGGTDEDAIRGILSGKSKQEIDDLAAAYQQKYGHGLRDRLAEEAEDPAEEQEILSLFDAGRDGEQDPRVVLEREAARLKQAVDGWGTDEGAIREILQGKSKTEVDALTRTYQDRYGHGLRDRLRDELGGREEKELVEQLFDRGDVDPSDPNASAERLARLRELQQVEQGAGLSLTSTIQEALKGESDEQRLNRNAARAEQAAAGGNDARAGQLLGYAEGDLDSLQSSKDEAAEWAATGAMVVGSTVAVAATGGLAAPAVIGIAAAAGAVSGGGVYWGLEGEAADPADIARYTVEGAVTGATAGAGRVLVTGGKTVAAAEGAARVVPRTTEQSVADKLGRYLLNPDHPVGGPKAKWFREALGFTQENADDLARQIKFDPARAVATEATQHGQKFNQVIAIEGANGKTIDVPFIWIRNNDGVVRLVTSIPSKK